MNYYYFGDEYSDGSAVWWWWPNYFSSPKEFSIKRKHKRILFALVALYVTYRLSCFLFYLLSSAYRRLRPNSTDEPKPIITTQSGIIRFLEGIFVSFFGLTIGAAVYYAHKQQSSQLIEHLTGLYRKFLNEILFHSTGYELSRSNLNPNETLLVGTFLAVCILYIMWGMLRFLVYHYIFGFALSLFGLFLYYYQFPITSRTAQTYSGTMFIIDRQHQYAYLVPSLIPKFLLTITIGYYLLLALLKSFTLFLKMSFRFLLYSLIATILLNSVTSIISEQIPSTNIETTITPEYQF